MPLYEFTALESTGRTVTGTLSAANRSTALDQVASRGFTPVKVTEHDARGAGALGGSGRVHPRQIEMFTRELANLLQAGVPLSRGLSILCRESSSAPARRQWTAIQEDVAGGVSLADAMSRWPITFPPVYVAMVRAGEEGGFLDLVLSQIAEFRTRERDLKGKVKGALAYPAVLAVVAAGVLTFLMTFFIPRFSTIFREFGSSLPVLTRAIVAVSHAVTDYGPLTLAVIVAIVLLLRRLARSQAGRRIVQKALIEAPALGTVLARFALVRFCRMLGTLLGAGVPLVNSLRVSREAIGNQILADAVTVAIEEVRQGKSLAKSLAACPKLFPPSVVEMVAVAEESSRLDVELKRLADAYESDLDRRLRLLVSLAEPALLFIMAALVGTVVIGMLLPVFTLQDLVH